VLQPGIIDWPALCASGQFFSALAVKTRALPLSWACFSNVSDIRKKDDGNLDTQRLRRTDCGTVFREIGSTITFDLCRKMADCRLSEWSGNLVIG
jgi:hypothetical protein